MSVILNFKNETQALDALSAAEALNQHSSATAPADSPLLVTRSTASRLNDSGKIRR